MSLINTTEGATRIGSKKLQTFKNKATTIDLYNKNYPKNRPNSNRNFITNLTKRRSLEIASTKSLIKTLNRKFRKKCMTL